jgi:hypothetical protein
MVMKMNVEVNGKVVLNGESCWKAMVSFWEQTKKQTAQAVDHSKQAVDRFRKMKVAITY